MTSTSVLIEPATADVLDEVLAIEQACFSAPWTRKMLAAELSGNQFANFLIAKCPDPLSGSLALAGYFCFWVVFEEVRLMNLAVLAPLAAVLLFFAAIVAALGYLQARRGAGFFVTERRDRPAREHTPKVTELAVDAHWLSRNVYQTDAGALQAGCGWFPPDWFDRDSRQRALKQAARYDSALAEYGHPQGYAPLRRYLEDWLGEAGMAVPAEHILLTQGASQAQRRPSTSAGSRTMPHTYRLSPALQRSALQAPCRRRDTTMPSGHGSTRQHTPQPLHGWPQAGLGGAAGSM